MNPAEGALDGLPPFLTDPVAVLRRRWPWVVAAVLVGLVATGVVVSLQVSLYAARAALLVTPQQIPAQFVSVNLPSNPLESVDPLIGQILARENLVALIRKYHFYGDDGQKRDTVELVDRFRSNVEIAPGKTIGARGGPAGASVYTIAFRDRDPQRAADVANELATAFADAATRIRGQQTRLAIDFMRAQVASSETEMREQERLIAQFKESYRGELPSELATNLSKLDRLTSQREALQQQISAAENRLATVDQMSQLSSPSSPHARIVALRARLAEQEAVNTDEHPNVIATRRQIEALEREIASGETVPRGLREEISVRDAVSEIAGLKIQLAKMVRESEELEARVERTPKREEEVEALSQKASVLQENYLGNLRKLKAAELTASVESAQQGTQVQVLDRAIPPTEPVTTRIRLALLGIGATLAVALGLGLLLELLDPVVVSAAQLERELGVEVIGAIGRIA